MGFETNLILFDGEGNPLNLDLIDTGIEQRLEGKLLFDETGVGVFNTKELYMLEKVGKLELIPEDLKLTPIQWYNSGGIEFKKAKTNTLAATRIETVNVDSRFRSKWIWASQSQRILRKGDEIKFDTSFAELTGNTFTVLRTEPERFMIITQTPNNVFSNQDITATVTALNTIRLWENTIYDWNEQNIIQTLTGATNPAITVVGSNNEGVKILSNYLGSKNLEIWEWDLSGITSNLQFELEQLTDRVLVYEGVWSTIVTPTNSIINPSDVRIINTVDGVFNIKPGKTIDQLTGGVNDGSLTPVIAYSDLTNWYNPISIDNGSNILRSWGQNSNRDATSVNGSIFLNTQTWSYQIKTSTSWTQPIKVQAFADAVGPLPTADDISGLTDNFTQYLIVADIDWSNATEKLRKTIEQFYLPLSENKKKLARWVAFWNLKFDTNRITNERKTFPGNPDLLLAFVAASYDIWAYNIKWSTYLKSSRIKDMIWLDSNSWRYYIGTEIWVPSKRINLEADFTDIEANIINYNALPGQVYWASDTGNKFFKLTDWSKPIIQGKLCLIVADDSSQPLLEDLNNLGSIYLTETKIQIEQPGNTSVAKIAEELRPKLRGFGIDCWNEGDKILTMSNTPVLGTWDKPFTYKLNYYSGNTLVLVPSGLTSMPGYAWETTPDKTERLLTFGNPETKIPLPVKWSRELRIFDLDSTFGIELTIDGMVFTIRDGSSNIKSNIQDLIYATSTVLASKGIKTTYTDDTIRFEANYPLDTHTVKCNTGFEGNHGWLINEWNILEPGQITITLDGDVYKAESSTTISGTTNNWFNQFDADMRMIEITTVVSGSTISLWGKDDRNWSETFSLGKAELPGLIRWTSRKGRPENKPVLLVWNRLQSEIQDFEQIGISTGMVLNIGSTFYPSNTRSYKILQVDPNSLTLSWQGSIIEEKTGSIRISNIQPGYLTDNFNPISFGAYTETDNTRFYIDQSRVFMETNSKWTMWDDSEIPNAPASALTWTLNSDINCIGLSNNDLMIGTDSGLLLINNDWNTIGLEHIRVRTLTSGITIDNVAFENGVYYYTASGTVWSVTNVITSYPATADNLIVSSNGVLAITTSSVTYYTGIAYTLPPLGYSITQSFNDVLAPEGWSVILDNGTSEISSWSGATWITITSPGPSGITSIAMSGNIAIATTISNTYIVETLRSGDGEWYEINDYLAKTGQALYNSTSIWSGINNLAVIATGNTISLIDIATTGPSGTTEEYLRKPSIGFNSDPVARLRWTWQDDSDKDIFYFDISGDQLKTNKALTYTGPKPLFGPDRDRKVVLNREPNRDVTRVDKPEWQQTIFEELVFDLPLRDEDLISGDPEPIQVLLGYGPTIEGINQKVAVCWLEYDGVVQDARTVAETKFNLVTFYNTGLIQWTNTDVDLYEAGFRVGMWVRFTGKDEQSEGSKGIFINNGLEGRITRVTRTEMEIVSESAITNETSIKKVLYSKFPYPEYEIGLTIRVEAYMDQVCRIAIAGQSEDEDWRLKTMMDNLGINLKREDNFIFDDYPVQEQGQDWVFLNSKRKELLLNHSEIWTWLGSYKSLVNSVKFFGYENLELYEYYKDLNRRSPWFNKLVKIEIPQILSTGSPQWDGREFRPELSTGKYSKTKLLNITYRITDREGNNILAYSLDEIIIKLFGLRRWLEQTVIPMGTRILDITGQADIVSRPEMTHTSRFISTIHSREEGESIWWTTEAYKQPVLNDSDTWIIHIDFVGEGPFTVEIQTFQYVGEELVPVQLIREWVLENKAYNFVVDRRIDPHFTIEVRKHSGFGLSWRRKRRYTVDIPGLAEIKSNI